MTPEERASALAKWVAADLRQRHWMQIRDSVVEALAEEREACARVAEETAAGWDASRGDAAALAAAIVSAIRRRDAR